MSVETSEVEETKHSSLTSSTKVSPTQVGEVVSVVEEQPPLSTVLKGFILSWKTWKFGIYGYTMLFSTQILVVAIPVYGAKFFHEQNASSDCGNAKWAYYHGIFSSVGGMLGFLFQPYLGSHVVWLLITSNLWIFLATYPIQALNGNYITVPTVIEAGVTDMMPPYYRTTLWAVLYAIAGVFILVVSLNIFGLLWLIFITEETLDIKDRKQMKGFINPFKPLLDMRKNDIFLWVGLITLITALPESGIDNIIINYVNDLLKLCNSDRATTMSSNGIVCLGAGLLFAQLCVLPILNKYFNDIQLYIIGLVILTSFFMFGVLLYFYRKVFFVLIIYLFFGISYMLSAITIGSFTKRISPREQGMGIGILHSMKGLTYCIGPYIFSSLYFHNKNNGFSKTSPFIFAVCLCIIGFPIILFPIKKAFNKYDKLKSNIELTNINSNNKNNINNNLITNDEIKINKSNMNQLIQINFTKISQESNSPNSNSQIINDKFNENENTNIR